MRRRIILALVFIGLLLGSAVGLLVGTTWGLRLGIGWVGRVADLEIRVTGAQGRLLGPMTFAELFIRHPDWQVTSEELDLDWEPLALFRRTLVITQLAATDVRVESSGAESKSSGAPPEIAWNIALRDLTVDRLTVAGPEEALVVEKLALEAALTDGRVVLGSVQLNHAERAYGVAGWVDLESDYPHRLSLTVSDPDASARVRAEGDLDQTTVEVTAERFGLAAAGQISDIRDGLNWRLEGTVRAPAQLPELDTRFELEGDLGGARGRVSGQYQDREFAVSDLRTTWLDGFSATLRGVTVTDPEVGGQLTLRIDDAGRIIGEIDFSGQLAGGPVEGRLSGAGSPENFEVQGIGQAFEAVHWTLEGDGNQSGMERLKFTAVHAEAGRLGGEGQLSWTPTLDWHFAYEAEDLNPEPWRGAWPASIDLRGRASGTGDRSDWSVETLGGRLLGREISGSARLVLSSAGIEDVTGDLASGSSRITISGAWVPSRKRLSGILDVANLGDFLPDAGGSLEARYELGGSELELHADGSELRFMNSQVGQLEVEGVVATVPDRPSELRVSATEVQLAGEPVESIAGTVVGPPDALAIGFSMGAKRGNLRSELTADVSAVPFRAAISALELSNENFGRWNLTETVDVVFSREMLSLQRACLSAASGELCVQADLPPDDAGRLEVILSNVAAELLEIPVSAVAGEPVHLGGVLDGRLVVQTAGFEVETVDAQVTASGSIRLPARADLTTLEVEKLEMTVGGTGEEIAADLGVDAGGAAVTAQLVVLGPFGDDPVLRDSRLDVRVAKLSPFEAWVPEIAELGGSLLAQLEISGPLSSPATAGHAELSGLAFRVRDFGTHVSNGSAKLVLDSDGNLEVSAGLPTAQGTVSIHGQGVLEGLQITGLDLTLEGDQVVIADAPDLRLIASPKLRLARTAEDFSLRGRIVVDSARIERTLAEAAVRPSADVVLIGETPESDRNILDLAAIEIAVEIPEPIEFAGFGVEAELTGQVTVSDAPGEPQRASGELMLTGTYRAYGQRLTIRNGSLVYAGTPLDNPAIRIEAFREVDGVRAGVRVSGRAAAPAAELYSEPPMEDSNILSYLLLGRPLNAASEDEANYLGNAALALAMRAGNNLSEGIGSQLGFEMLSLAVSEDLGGAALVIGRYLAPNLYLSYSIGLLAPVDLLELEYRLSRQWSLKTELGTETRASLQYRIERGGPAVQPDS